MASPNKTPLFDYHFEVGAKMVPVGNWTMPFQFGNGYKAEYMHAFEGTCITDFCCAEIYRMTGANAEKMQKITEFAAVGDCGFCEWKKEDRLIDSPFAVCMAEGDFLTAFAELDAAKQLLGSLSAEQAQSHIVVIRIGELFTHGSSNSAPHFTHAVYLMAQVLCFRGEQVTVLMYNRHIAPPTAWE